MYILIIAIGGFAGVSDMKFERIETREQCHSIIDGLRPLSGSIGAICVAPDGTTYEINA